MDPVITWIYLIFLQYFWAYIDLNKRFSKPVFEEKPKKSWVLTLRKIQLWKMLLKGTDWDWFGTYSIQSPSVVRTQKSMPKWPLLMSAIQCTILIETCPQCTISSILDQNFTYKLARFGAIQRFAGSNPAWATKISKIFISF